MKKRLLATALVATLMFSFVGSVFAATQELEGGESEANIEFEEYEIGPEIPDDPNYYGLFGINDLDFWTHYISLEDETYLSWTGVDPYNSGLGLPIATSRNFTLMANLTEFILDGDDSTLAGAVLELEPGGQEFQALGWCDDAEDYVVIGNSVNYLWQSWNNADVDARFNLNPSIEMIADGDAIEFLYTEDVQEGVRHDWAANFIGELTVFAGTAELGVAQAEIVWTFIVDED